MTCLDKKILADDYPVLDWSKPIFTQEEVDELLNGTNGDEHTDEDKIVYSPRKISFGAKIYDGIRNFYRGISDRINHYTGW